MKKVQRCLPSKTRALVDQLSLLKEDLLEFQRDLVQVRYPAKAATPDTR